MTVPPSAIAPLGIDLSAVFARLDQLEDRMTEIDTTLDQIDATVAAHKALLTDVAADVAVLTASLGDITPEQQVVVDRIFGNLGSEQGLIAGIDLAVGDADGSDTPPPAPVEG